MELRSTNFKKNSGNRNPDEIPYTSGNGSPKKASYISRNGTFQSPRENLFYFRKRKP